jgi:hypothetical protein
VSGHTTGVFDAAVNSTGWCVYLGLEIDIVIRLAIKREDEADSALMSPLYRTYGHLCCHFERFDDARATLGQALEQHQKRGDPSNEGNDLRLLVQLRVQGSELDKS